MKAEAVVTKVNGYEIYATPNAVFGGPSGYFVETINGLNQPSRKFFDTFDEASAWIKLQYNRYFER